MNMNKLTEEERILITNYVEKELAIHNANHKVVTINEDTWLVRGVGIRDDAKKVSLDLCISDLLDFIKFNKLKQL